MLYLKATNRPLLFPLPIVERILEIPPDDKVDRVSKYPTNKYQSLLAYQRKVSCEHISTLDAEDTAALRHVCSLDLQYVQPIIHFQTYTYVVRVVKKLSILSKSFTSMVLRLHERDGFNNYCDHSQLKICLLFRIPSVLIIIQLQNKSSIAICFSHKNDAAYQILQKWLK